MINRVKTQYKELVANMFPSGNRNYSRWSKRILDLKNQYSGNRCVIMGNGPSLNKMDLNLFNNEFVWVSNRAYLLFNRIDWRPFFYIAVDRKVVPVISDELQSLASKYTNTKYFFPKYFYRERILKSNENIYWFNDDNYKRKYDMDLFFSIKPDEIIDTHSTVTIAALQLAVFLGFNPIYLIGCDTSYVIPKTIEKDKNNPNIYTSVEDDDPNHFSKEYFGKGKVWQNPRVDRMIEHYKIAYEKCQEIGVSVFNATIGGNLEVFPRVNYEKIFRNKN